MIEEEVEEFIPRGKYIIWIEHNTDYDDVYSTDSVFWRDFFR